MSVRWELVSYLGELADGRALSALTERALADPNPHVRWRSLWALRKLPERAQVVALLRNGLHGADGADGADSAERWNAAVGLTMFGRGDGLRLLLVGAVRAGPWRR